jgi:hypothetical protein
MEHELLRRDGSIVNFPRNAMGAIISIFNAKEAIAFGMFTRAPDPARSFENQWTIFIDFGPETVLNR